MLLDSNTTYLLIGAAVGGASSLIGAIVDYLIARRRGKDETRRLPGCMLLTTGGLGFAGLIVAILSLFFTHSLRPVIFAGFGVLLGFSAAFFLLALPWTILTYRRTQKNAARFEKGQSETKRPAPFQKLKSPTSE